MTSLAHCWRQLGHPRLLVVGDLLLDRYVWGEAERISPEAPVLVLREEEQDVRPGGAANVASFLRGLEADVALVGVVGNDAEGRKLNRLLANLAVDAAGVVTVRDRPTTAKQRFVGRTANRQPHQILRVDRETREPIPPAIECRLLAVVSEQLSQSDAVLISDYGKGVCTPTFLRSVIAAARTAGKVVMVDPCRDVDYGRYAEATLVAPNRLATQRRSGRRLRDENEIRAVAKLLRDDLRLDAAVITLDKDGMALATADAAEILPCLPRAVCDVTGAGDMVITVLGLCLADGIPVRDSLQLANVAAGLEVERFGVEALCREEIAAELAAGEPTSAKVTTPESLRQQIERQQCAGRTIVFTNGCFDLLHVGHVTLLQAAARLGDFLVVAINSDASVRKLKGPERPVISQDDRARMLAALDCVDHVLIFDDETPCRLLEMLRPDVLVKGGTTEHIVGREIVEAHGGQVVRAGEVPGRSTTSLLSQIVQTSVADRR